MRNTSHLHLRLRFYRALRHFAGPALAFRMTLAGRGQA